MMTALWSAKGGQGVSVTAGLLALRTAQDSQRPVWLVDLCGDQARIFGARDTGAGLSDWLNSDLSPTALHNHLIELTPDLSLLTPGQGPVSARRVGELVGHFAEHDITAVVDAGRIDPATQTGESGDDFFRREIVERADKSVLVTRACYLSLSKIVGTQMRPSQVVLVAEAGRALTRKGCEHVIGAPVAATVAVDPDIARSVDAGMLRTKVPNQAIRALGPVAGQPPWHTPTIRLAPEVEFD